MDSNIFIELAKHIYLNEVQESKEDTIFIVWASKILQNNKALISSPEEGAPYIEVTYNGDKEEFYVDVYQKIRNQAIPLIEDI